MEANDTIQVGLELLEGKEIATIARPRVAFLPMQVKAQFAVTNAEGTRTEVVPIEGVIGELTEPAFVDAFKKLTEKMQELSKRADAKG